MSKSNALAGLKQRCDKATRDEFLKKAVQFTANSLRDKKLESTRSLGNWESWREKGRAIRAHTIANLDFYLDQFTRNAEANGAHIHFAKNAEEAAGMILRIVEAKNAKLVAKSKSMVSEEIRINKHLEAAGIECVETDLGEWIIQLADEGPSHLIIPAIHKTREQIRSLFEKKGNTQLTDETEVLAGFARKTLRDVFTRASIGLTGCNFAIAETGSVVIFTNEGNGRMVTTLPKTHIVTMGMERIIPTLADLHVFSTLLPRSATGQKITSYMQILSGPRKSAEGDGPEEMHIIVLDNGRSKLLGDPEFQELLHCIRCGACLNVCPVYRQVGGHAYASVYSGPIGAVLSPLLWPDEKYDLPYASSLCGACFESCPVKIPLHDMLVHLRRRNVEARRTHGFERFAFRIYATIFCSPAIYLFSSFIARMTQRLFLGEAKKNSWIHSGMGPVREWTKYRTLPASHQGTFHKLWKKFEKKTRDVKPNPIEER